MISKINPSALPEGSISETHLNAALKSVITNKQDALTLTVKDNGNIVLSSIQGQSKEFMPATPTGDPLHWAYVKRGAEYNDTGADIIKTAPWADLADDEADKTVVHKAGRWYLNGIGDLTTEEIRNIYHFQPIFECVGRGINYLLCQNPCRVFFDMISNAMTIGYNFENVSYASSVLVLPFKTARASKLSAFIYNSTVKHILGTLETITNASTSNAFETTTLRTLKLVKLCVNVTFKKCSQLTLKSILYMIQNEAATSAITITLHADVYAKAMADESILAALAEHTNVSLADAGATA